MRLIGLALLFVLGATTLLPGQNSTFERQDNIIPNAGFERYSGTPIGWFYKGQHFSTVMKYWNSATGASPDIFGPKVRVPSHWAAKGFGDQQPHNGESMVGITVFGCEQGKPHCREYIQIQMSEPLVIGQNYYAEFWVNHLPRSLQTDNLGMYFSEEQVKMKIDAPLKFSPQIEANHIVSAASKSWVKISGRFTAETEASYLIIGNFYPDSLTQVKKPVANHLNYAYYYIDDVLVKKEEPILTVPLKPDDLSQITIEEGKIVQLKNIFFDHDKSELLPRSYIELHKLRQLMLDHPTMIIEISGHTDAVGNFDYNLYLSRKRAQSVVEFLNNNGVARKRTRYKGYGNMQPVASNDTEEGRSLNRRVEFLIIHK
ncbi:MAG: OmpA family protein [Bacteroidota bacterium]